MNVLFVLSGDIHSAGSRYRAYQFFDHLREHGITCSVSTSGNAWLPDSLALLPQAARADVVFIQKRLFPAWQVWLLRRWNPRIVFDFDDAVFLHPTQQFGDTARARAKSRRRLGRFVRICRAARHVIAGNEFLKQHASPYADRVTLIPTCVSLDAYQARPATGSGPELVIGWIGQACNLHYLDLVRNVLERIGEAYPAVCLRIVSSAFTDFSKIRVDKKRWKLEEEIADVQGFDIGIMPLRDDPWSRGKCGFKALQCMAAAVPVVVSPVGVNREIVTDGVNGFWARNEAEWFEALVTLIRDPARRAEMGLEGRKRVDSRYSLHVNAPLLQSVILSAAAGTTVPA